MLVIAHRGYSSRYRENTLPAFEAAIRGGADLIETDLRLSRDGAIVCIHDKTLQRVAGLGDRVADLDVEALKRIDIGDGLTVPIFDEVLKLVNGRAGLLLDIKVATDEMADRIVEAIDRHRACRGIVCGVRSLDQLDALRRHKSKIPCLALLPDYCGIGEWLGRGVQAVRLWEEDLTKERIGLVRGAARDLWVTAGLKSKGETTGTIGGARLADLAKRGVDAVLVNDPVMAAGMQGHCEFNNQWWMRQ